MGARSEGSTQRGNRDDGVIEGNCQIEANKRSPAIQSSSQSLPVSPKNISGNNIDNDTIAAPGHVITLDLELNPENGFVPEPLFDTNGVVRFVLGWGNYLPGLHSLCEGMKIGEEISGASIDAGWGERKEDLLIDIPKANLRRHFNNDDSLITVGSTLNLQGGNLHLVITEVHEDTVIVDANPPLAGASYSCNLKVLNIEPIDNLLTESQTAIVPKTTGVAGTEGVATDTTTRGSSRYEVSTWALGCFWGGELAFMRVPGVVGTRVGYTQGTTANPTYEDVCSARTQHREAIMVVYDAEVVSYSELMRIALERLKTTYSPNATSMIYKMFDEPLEEESLSSLEEPPQNFQYKPGFYHHSRRQNEIAAAGLRSRNDPFSVEIRAATTFYKAEEHHQQYLLKGGQSAKKGSKEAILCYG